MEGRLLEACAESLARQIAPRAQIADVTAPARDRIDLLISGGGGARRRIVADLAPERATLYLARPDAGGAADGAEALRRSLAGKWIVGVDRPVPRALIRLLLQESGGEGSETWLIFEWLGARPDALAVDGRTLEVLARTGGDAGTHADRRAVGGKYAWPPPPRRPLYAGLSEGDIRAILQGIDGIADRARALSRGCAGLPAYLALEALHRAGTIDRPASDAEIARALREISEDPLEPALYIVANHSSLGLPPAFVSPIPLASLSGHREMTVTADLFLLLERAHGLILQAERRSRIRDGFLRLIASEERRIMRLYSRLKAEEDATARASSFRRNAEALLIHIAEIPRGAARFTCPDPNDPTVPLEIDLDPKASVSANAEALFRRARRLERGAPLRTRRLAAIDAAVARLSVLRRRVEADAGAVARGGAALFEEALGPFTRDTILKEWAGIGGQAPRSRPRPVVHSRHRATPVPRRASEERFHPRTYRTREGWTVLVGRSNEENDYVTHGLAKPDDYWFHAHGCPGSHVVLRREGRKDNPSARTIEEVASIAAWFSKARTSRRAPISYTLKKYVRKPRKGPPGLALITREKTILVEPKAPAGADAGGWGDEERGPAGE